MGSIFLIRHGQASFGADDYDVLSPVGVRQAEVLGEHLEQLGIAFDRCVSGSLRRQQHTANAALQRHLPAYRLFPKGNLVQLGMGAAQQRIWTAESDQTGAIAQDIASDKALTKRLLANIEGGNKELEGLRDTIAQHPIEKTGRELRQMFSWLKDADDDYTEGTAAR